MTQFLLRKPQRNEELEAWTSFGGLGRLGRDVSGIIFKSCGPGQKGDPKFSSSWKIMIDHSILKGLPFLQRLNCVLANIYTTGPSKGAVAMDHISTSTRGCSQQKIDGILKLIPPSEEIMIIFGFGSMDLSLYCKWYSMIIWSYGIIRIQPTSFNSNRLTAKTKGALAQ